MKAEQSTLDKIRSRPRFKIQTDLSPEAYTAALKKFIDEKSDEFSATAHSELATIAVKTEQTPFWKPYLSLRSSSENHTTVIRGVFGPSPSVWTFFMFLYFALLVLWMVLITLWFVGRQIKSEDYHWALPASFLTATLLLLTYIASKIGQQKAKKEMAKLRKFAIDSSLKFEKR
ncbi:hypothetical protein [Bergeyella sp. RCAD1439]|uniref:hypothetical protein n=1 Tax=Bergeyella anatis TaxID=3113737 RepID=UPI002E17E46C|nr:hypothetical protein [Bergeyella sp. RCAD1439]